jgi:hypothetical protein
MVSCCSCLIFLILYAAPFDQLGMVAFAMLSTIARSIEMLVVTFTVATLWYVSTIQIDI